MTSTPLPELTPRMQEALHTASELNGWTLTGNGHTLRALARRGMATEPVSYRDGSAARLTDHGREYLRAES